MDYHELAKETSKAVDVMINKYLENSDETTALLPTKRLGTPRLRDTSIRLGYEVSGGKNWPEVIPVCAAYELENCSSYVINWILDEKGGARTRKEVNNLIIAGMQLRELSQLVLHEHDLEEIIPSINSIQRAGYRGQHADLNTLKVENISEFSTLESLMDAYEKRCTDLSGVFHGHCLLSGSMVAKNPHSKLYELGELFGASLQASNDLGDFTPPTKQAVVIEKPYNDQFSDFKQGKLTLPVYLVLTNSSARDQVMLEEKVGKQEFTKEDCDEILNCMHKTGTISTCDKYLRDKKKKIKKMLHSEIPESPNRDLISQMFALISSNKFLHNLRKYKPAS